MFGRYRNPDLAPWHIKDAASWFLLTESARHETLWPHEPKLDLRGHRTPRWYYGRFPKFLCKDTYIARPFYGDGSVPKMRGVAYEKTH